MDWAFFSKWTGLKLSFGFRKNRQQPKQGGKKKWQILEFSQKKLGEEELKVELVKNKGKKICFANFGIFAEKTWKRRIEGGISEKQGDKNLPRKFSNFRRKNLEKKN